jgi:hypothetical protein
MPGVGLIPLAESRKPLSATGRNRDGSAALGQQHRNAAAHSAARPSHESHLASEIERIDHLGPAQTGLKKYRVRQNATDAKTGCQAHVYTLRARPPYSTAREASG